MPTDGSEANIAHARRVVALMDKRVCAANVGDDYGLFNVQLKCRDQGVSRLSSMAEECKQAPRASDFAKSDNFEGSR